MAKDRKPLTKRQREALEQPTVLFQRLAESLDAGAIEVTPDPPGRSARYRAERERRK